MSDGWFAVALALALAVVLTFLTLPVVAIFVQQPPGELIAALGEEGALDALWLSLRTTAAALALILLAGTPAAYLLATRRFRGRAVLITLIELPLVLTFVSAPFYLRQAIAAFEAVDPTLLDASRTLGASAARTFRRIAIPTALPGLVAGTALALGRALGEFGATLMFAGSFQGITQTVPLAIYDRFATDFTDALALSAVLVAVSAGILLAVKLVRGPGVLGGAVR